MEGGLTIITAYGGTLPFALHVMVFHGGVDVLPGESRTVCCGAGMVTPISDKDKGLYLWAANQNQVRSGRGSIWANGVTISGSSP